MDGYVAIFTFFSAAFQSYYDNSGREWGGGWGGFDNLSLYATEPHLQLTRFPPPAGIEPRPVSSASLCLTY